MEPGQPGYLPEGQARPFSIDCEFEIRYIVTRPIVLVFLNDSPAEQNQQRIRYLESPQRWNDCGDARYHTIQQLAALIRRLRTHHPCDCHRRVEHE